MTHTESELTKIRQLLEKIEAKLVFYPELDPDPVIIARSELENFAAPAPKSAGKPKRRK
jgi:hypothetical protein